MKRNVCDIKQRLTTFSEQIFTKIQSWLKLSKLDNEKTIKTLKLKKMKIIFFSNERLYGYCMSAKFSFSCNAVFIFSCIFFFTLDFSGSIFSGQALDIPALF